MKLNFHFFIVLVIACIAVINDILIYCFNLNYIASLIISTVIIGVVYILFIKKKKIILESNFEKLDLFFFVFWITYLLIKISIPDMDWDTKSYHIYLQENFFVDKINFDFFPGRIYCVYLFPLGDRIHYIFRYFLGYRLGTIFSFYTMITLFYQTKILLKEYTNNSKLCSVISIFIFAITIILYKFPTYYIDNLGLIFLIQIFIMLKKDEDIIKNRFKLNFCFLFIGLAIGIKITNLFFIISLGIFYLVKNYKKIKELNFNFMLALFFSIIPYMIYLIDNYKQTGSILFPYYNSIFKSEYFGFFNWIDPRFGISGIIKKVLWPIIGSFVEVNYGTSMDVWRFEKTPIWAIGYVFCIIYICLNKKNKSLKTLALVALINTAIWIAFLEGYFRYGIFVCFLYCILMYSCIINFLEKRKYKILRFRLKLYFYIMLLFNIKNDSKSNYIRKNAIRVFSFFIIVCGIVGILSIYKGFNFENVKYCLKDRKNESNQIKIDGVWGTLEDLSIYASLVRYEDDPIINLEKSHINTQEKTLNLWYEKIKNNDIYVILEKNKDMSSFNKQLEMLKENSFEIEEIVKNLKSDDIAYIDSNSTWLLVKLKYVGELVNE